MTDSEWLPMPTHPPAAPPTATATDAAARATDPPASEWAALAPPDPELHGAEPPPTVRILHQADADGERWAMVPANEAARKGSAISHALAEPTVIARSVRITPPGRPPELAVGVDTAMHVHTFLAPTELPPAGPPTMATLFAHLLYTTPDGQRRHQALTAPREGRFRERDLLHILRRFIGATEPGATPASAPTPAPTTATVNERHTLRLTLRYAPGTPAANPASEQGGGLVPTARTVTARRRTADDHPGPTAANAGANRGPAVAIIGRTQTYRLPDSAAAARAVIGATLQQQADTLGQELAQRVARPLDQPGMAATRAAYDAARGTPPGDAPPTEPPPD